MRSVTRDCIDGSAKISACLDYASRAARPKPNAMIGPHGERFIYVIVLNGYGCASVAIIGLTIRKDDPVVDPVLRSPRAVGRHQDKVNFLVMGCSFSI